MNLFFNTQKIIFFYFFITSALHATQKITKEQVAQIKRTMKLAQKNPLLDKYFPLKREEFIIREATVSDSKQLYNKINETLKKDESFYKHYATAKSWSLSIDTNKRIIPMLNKTHPSLKGFYVINLVICKDVRDIIGVIEIQKLNRKSSSASLGYYRIDTQVSKSGIITNAVKELSNFLLRNRLFDKIYLEIQSDNKKSIKLASKAGFKIAKNHNYKSLAGNEERLFFEKKAKNSKL